jgi:hypothetical protein
MSDIAPANAWNVAAAQFAEVIIPPWPRVTPLSYADDARFSLTGFYNIARGMVLDGISLSRTPSVNWKYTKHCVKDGSDHHRIILFLESRGGHATVAEIAAAVPTRYPIGHYLREMVKQGIIMQ